MIHWGYLAFAIPSCFALGYFTCALMVMAREARKLDVELEEYMRMDDPPLL